MRTTRSIRCICVSGQRAVARKYNEKLIASRESCLECFITFSLKRSRHPTLIFLNYGVEPTEVAKFIGDFDHYGRQHSGKYGHQKLSKAVRTTIRLPTASRVWNWTTAAWVREC